MNKIFAGVVVVLALAGCAKRPDDITATYIDPGPYRTMSCAELERSAQAISAQAMEAAGVQDKKATNDAVLTGVGIVVFWPALLFTSRDSAGEAQIASLKGQMNAIEMVSAEKNCGIAFDRAASETEES